MAKLLAQKSTSDHIRIDAFPAAKTKGDLVAIGSLIGIVDIDVAAGHPGSIDVGKQVAIFVAKTADFAGTAAIGTDVFTDGNTLTTTGKLVGTIVAIGSDTIAIARV